MLVCGTLTLSLIAVILGQWVTDVPSSFGVTTFVLTVSSVRR